MKARLMLAGAALAASASQLRADTNLDNLVAQINTTFATAAGVAVAVTIFFIGRKLLRRGTS